MKLHNVTDNSGILQQLLFVEEVYGGGLLSIYEQQCFRIKEFLVWTMTSEYFSIILF